MMRILAALPLAGSLLYAQGEPAEAEFEGFRARMALEIGQLVEGNYRRVIFDVGGAKTESIELRNIPLNRNIVYLDYRAEPNEYMRYDVGLKGILWWPFSTEAGGPGTRTIRVMPDMSMLRARWTFAGEEGKSFLEFGYLPYKYNPDAWNLGEYLYRSGTYPGEIVTTNGFEFMNHAYLEVVGVHARLSMMDGVITQDLNLFSETHFDPIGDLTPAYQISLNTPWLEAGFGAAWYRGLAYHPSKNRPNSEENQFIRVKADSAATYGAYEGPFPGAPSAVRDNAGSYDVVSRWTQRGIKLMGRLALNLGGILPEALRSPHDLRLYAEAAVLGVEDQPYYYTDMKRRVPVMLGINVPTFRLLDVFAVQAEYYDAVFNNTEKYHRNSLPIWTVGNYATQDLDSYSPSKWRWSAFAKRSVNQLLTVHAQVARDHLRPRDLLSTPTTYEVTAEPGSWYYLFRMEIGI